MARGAEAGPVASRCGGAVEMCGQVYFLAPRGRLTSGFLLHPCSRMSAPPPPSTPPPPATSPLTSHPRRMEGGGGFPDADLRLPPLPTPTKLASSLRLPDASPPFDASAWTRERHICCSSDAPARGGADGEGCAASAEGL